MPPDSCLLDVYITYIYLPLLSPYKPHPFNPVILLVGVDACGVELTSCYYVSTGAQAVYAEFNCWFLPLLTH